MKKTVIELSKINKTKHDLFIQLCNGIAGKLGYPEIKSIEDLDGLRKKYSGAAVLALLAKCEHMIFNIGSPDSVEGFLKRVAIRKKNQTQPGFRGDAGESLGVCHFRWDWRGYELDKRELLALRSYLNVGDATVNQDFIYQIGNIEVRAALKESGVRWPADDSSMLHNKFQVRVVNTDTHAGVKFDFYGSYTDCTKDVTVLDAEGLKGALECFLLDAMSGEYSFADFCSEYGYDQDSRAAKKTHKSCVKAAEKFRKLDVDIYELSNLLNA